MVTSTTLLLDDNPNFTRFRLEFHRSDLPKNGGDTQNWTWQQKKHDDLLGYTGIPTTFRPYFLDVWGSTVPFHIYRIHRCSRTMSSRTPWASRVAPARSWSGHQVRALGRILMCHDVPKVSQICDILRDFYDIYINRLIYWLYNIHRLYIDYI